MVVIHWPPFCLICHQGEPLAARGERNRGNSWELSLCTGCSPCHFVQRACPETVLVSYCKLISHPVIHLYLKLEVNRIWSDLRVYWEQGWAVTICLPFPLPGVFVNKESVQLTVPTAALHLWWGEYKAVAFCLHLRATITTQGPLSDVIW